MTEQTAVFLYLDKALRESKALLDEDRKDLDYTASEVTKETAEILQAVADKGVTLVRDNIGLIPVSKEKIKKVTIITYSHAPIISQLEVMKREFEKRGAEVKLRDKLESFNDAENVAAESDLIVYAGYIGFHMPKGSPSFYDDVFWSLRYAFTEGKEKSVGVSLGYPFIHYDFMDDALAFVNLYVPAEETQKAFVAALYGEKKFEGIAPLDMTRKNAWKQN